MNILRHLLFGDKIIQNCLEIDAIHSYDNDLLLRQKTQKMLHLLEADIITMKKKSFDISKDIFFTGRVLYDRHCACLSNRSLSY